MGLAAAAATTTMATTALPVVSVFDDPFFFLGVGMAKAHKLGF